MLVHVCTQVPVCACLHVCVHVCMQVPVCVHMCVCVLYVESVGPGDSYSAGPFPLGK